MLIAVGLSFFVYLYRFCCCCCCCAEQPFRLYMYILWYIVFKVNLLTISKEYCVCLFSSLNYNENPFISSLFHPFAAKVLFLHIHIYLYEIIFLILMGFCWTNRIVLFHPMSRDLYTLFKKKKKNRKTEKIFQRLCKIIAYFNFCLINFEQTFRINHFYTPTDRRTDSKLSNENQQLQKYSVFSLFFLINALI